MREYYTIKLKQDIPTPIALTNQSHCPAGHPRVNAASRTRLHTPCWDRARLLGDTQSRDLYLLVDRKSTQEYLQSNTLPRHSTWADKMCPEGLDVGLSGESLPACEGLALVPALKSKERHPGKSEAAHKLSTHWKSTLLTAWHQPGRFVFWSGES